jgi:hypothetical protein
MRSECARLASATLLLSIAHFLHFPTPRPPAELKHPRHNSATAPYAAAGILLLLDKVDKAERCS